MSTPQFYACEYSAQMGEQLFATAPRTESWLLLEYPRAWAGKAYEDSSIPPDVKAHIGDALAQMPHSRLQMIAQGSRESLTDLTLYVIHAAWDAQHIRRFTLPTYEALLNLPLADIAAGRVELGEAVNKPLYIVCTNGKRDVCCARHGLPIYNALRAVGAQAWQCNHIGGHRLAGTLVAFPHGVYYGRVTPEDVPALLAAVSHGEMLLEHVRGRACLEAVAQAAEQFVRQQTDVLALDAFQPPIITATDGGWQAVFAERHGQTAHSVAFKETMTAFDIINNSAEPGGKPGVMYEFGI
jgi:hypothetical protein